MWLASLLAIRPALHSLARIPPRSYSSGSGDKKGANKMGNLLASLKKSEVEMKTTLGTRTGPDKEVHLHLPSSRRDQGTGQDRKKELDMQPLLKKRRKQRRNLGIMIYFKK